MKFVYKGVKVEMTENCLTEMKKIGIENPVEEIKKGINLALRKDPAIKYIHDKATSKSVFYFNKGSNKPGSIKTFGI